MIPICKKVLKGINYLCKDGTPTSIMDIMVFFHNHTNKLDLENTLEYLRGEGYIATSTDEDWMNISTTYKGRHYNKFSIEDIKRFLFHSLLVPVMVSLITALITYYITRQ